MHPANPSFIVTQQCTPSECPALKSVMACNPLCPASGSTLTTSEFNIQIILIGRFQILRYAHARGFNTYGERT